MKKNNDKKKFTKKIEKKKSKIEKAEEMYDYYNGSAGDRIKQKRKELKMTQETLAKQICSNTYISKMENNKVALNEEYLSLIMEKMGLTIDDINMPRIIIDYMYDSVKYFFYKDIEKYQVIFDDIKTFKPNVLIYIIAFGYHILTENYVEAEIYNKELSRYINNLEEYGFATYCIFSGFYHISTNNFTLAKEVIETTDGHLINDTYQLGMFNYLAYLAYGNLHLFSKASLYMDTSFSIFRNKNNYNRLAEISMYTNIFNVYEGSEIEDDNLEAQLSYLTDYQKNMYLFVLSTSDIESTQYSSLIEEDSFFYYIHKVLYAISAYENNQLDVYRKTKDEIKKIDYNFDQTYDVISVFNKLENKSHYQVIEYLKKEVEPTASKNQNIYLYKWLNKYITKLAHIRNRYKSSVDYSIRVDKKINSLQRKKDPRK